MHMDLKGPGICQTDLKNEVAEIDKELDEEDRKLRQGSNNHARRLQMYLEDRVGQLGKAVPNSHQ